MATEGKEYYSASTLLTEVTQYIEEKSVIHNANTFRKISTSETGALSF